MSEEQQPEQVPEQPAQELTFETALEKALAIALTRGAVVKGLAEVLKALEAGKVKMIFLAEDCDNEQYKTTLNALAAQFKVPVVQVETWESLKDYCKLGLPSATMKKVAEEKGKEAKIKPKCSSCAIIDWGEESDAKAFLEKKAQEQ